MPCKKEGRNLGDSSTHQGQQRQPAGHQKSGHRCGKEYSSQPSNRINPANTLIPGLQLPELRENKLLLLEPLSSWFSIVADLASSHTALGIPAKSGQPVSTANYNHCAFEGLALVRMSFFLLFYLSHSSGPTPFKAGYALTVSTLVSYRRLEIEPSKLPLTSSRNRLPEGHEGLLALKSLRDFRMLFECCLWRF